MAYSGGAPGGSGGEKPINKNQEHIIFVQRFWEPNKSTISSFSIDNGKVTGYFLEPPRGTYEESITKESGMRIPAGVYQTIPGHSKHLGKVMRFL